VDEFHFDEPKTKNFVKTMENLKAAGKSLVVLGADDASVLRASGNVPDAKTSTVNTINVYDLMNAQTVVLTKDAVAKIEEVYA
jgi:large subunit ribosomal protein L4